MTTPEENFDPAGPLSGRPSAWDLPSRIPGPGQPGRPLEPQVPVLPERSSKPAPAGDLSPEADFPPTGFEAGPDPADTYVGKRDPDLSGERVGDPEPTPDDLYGDLAAGPAQADPAPAIVPDEPMPPTEIPANEPSSAAPATPAASGEAPNPTVPDLDLSEPIYAVPPAPWNQPAPAAAAATEQVDEDAQVADTPAAAEDADDETDPATDPEVALLPDTDVDELESTMVRRTSLIQNTNDAGEVTEEGAPTGPSWQPRLADEDLVDAEDAIFAGATVRPEPVRRGLAHFLTALLSLVLVAPVWFLLVDAATRMAVPANGPWAGGPLNIAALFEMLAGAVLLFVLVFLARWSSLGTFLAGIILLLAGLPMLVAPAAMSKLLESWGAGMRNLGPFGENLHHHLTISAATGVFLIAGVILLALGFVSHGARRKGITAERMNVAAEAAKAAEDAARPVEKPKDKAKKKAKTNRRSRRRDR